MAPPGIGSQWWNVYPHLEEQVRNMKRQALHRAGWKERRWNALTYWDKVIEDKHMRVPFDLAVTIQADIDRTEWAQANQDFDALDAACEPFPHA